MSTVSEYELGEEVLKAIVVLISGVIILLKVLVFVK
jgi:hypothetical protein